MGTNLSALKLKQEALKRLWWFSRTVYTMVREITKELEPQLVLSDQACQGKAVLVFQQVQSASQNIAAIVMTDRTKFYTPYTSLKGVVRYA